MLKEAIRLINPSYGHSAARAIIEQALQATKFTPDIDVLEERERHLLFVCDELKKDHTQHRLLGPQALKCFPAFTQGSFRFWENGDPLEHRVPMKEEQDATLLKSISYFPPVAKIRGEVYAIRPETFLTLDPYKENTVQFVRQRIKLIVPYRRVVWLKDHNLDPDFGVREVFSRSDYTGSSIKTSREITHIIRAWMYIGNPVFWDNIITAFDWKSVEHHTSEKRRWLQNYYNIRRPPLPLK